MKLYKIFHWPVKEWYIYGEIKKDKKADILFLEGKGIYKNLHYQQWYTYNSCFYDINSLQEIDINKLPLITKLEILKNL